MKRAIIKRENLKNNIEVIKELYKDFNIIGVVKADAYGHGATTISSLLYDFGISTVAVATLEEAKELLLLDINQDILILGPSPFDGLQCMDNQKIIQTITSEDYYHEIIDLKVRKQVNINTGMNRLGIHYNDTFLTYLIKNKKIEGIYTHFLNNEQYDLVTSQLRKLKGIDKSLLVHTSITTPSFLNENNITTIRVGLALYGFEKFNWGKRLKPILSLYAKIINVMTVKAGDSVSYNATYVASKETTVGTVSIGYADGIPFNYKNGCVFYKGKLCKILGRITMDYIMIDLSEVEYRMYDYVEIFGENIPAEEIAVKSETIVYEILTRIGKRVTKEIV